MVKRWNFADWPGDGASMDPDTEGLYVLYSDYLLLQAALKEALEGWGQWLTNYPDNREMERYKRLKGLLLGEQGLGADEPRGERSSELTSKRLDNPAPSRELRAQFLTDK